MNKNRFNLRSVVAIAICFMKGATMFAQETNVVINGVKWATCNVGVPGTFVENPEDYGEYYQWNKGTTTDFLIYSDYFNSKYPESTTWLSANDPSPAGYRVPTSAEIQSLLNTTYVKYEWTTQNDVYGGRFTDITNNNSIFLPSAGYRNGSLGTVYDGVDGMYWSSIQCDRGGPFEVFHNAYRLYFYSNYSTWDINFDKSNGLSVRPVADDSTDINEVLVGTENATVIGYFDILGRKLKEEPTKGIYIIQYDNGKTKKMMK